MKSTITQQTKLAPLPALYRNTKHGDVVLFTDENVGTVVFLDTKARLPVNPSPTLFPLGYHATDWISCYDIDNWTRCPVGTKVELEQDN